MVQPLVEALKDYNAGTLCDPVLRTVLAGRKTPVGRAGVGTAGRGLHAAPEGKVLVTECLVALMDSTADDALLKTLNLDLLMHSRSDDARLCFFALACVTALWNTHGGKLLAFASETATFIAECSEDEHDMVVRETLRLKAAMESVAGNIAGL
ncbi:hypothetical protein B0H17DRAFT_1129186 [Mycena rosella]|uniref:U3 small nucleolar RNA-associated protein 10 n=1 Tax=Mycena rosella TaxID=1033263 RepID=A0AAD7DUR4_MYCRO|nr:hypothetical protein B0H17DRAFT_1129186 [Mycena rosella]